MIPRGMILLLLAALLGAPALAAPQESDAYVRHELQDPSTGKFHVVYDTSVIRPKARYYFNPVTKTTNISEEKITDLATGAVLPFQMVDAAQARADGFDDADPSLNYLRITLARPVPDDGAPVRIRIEKTYVDHGSFYAEGDKLIFIRSIGVKRNVIALPPGYILVACNFPSQVARQSDGRFFVSWVNTTPTDGIVRLEARKLADWDSGSRPIVERARETRNVVYVLNAPESHNFDINQDYTEETAGADHYLDVMGPDRSAAPPAVRNLDTGETLSARILKGADIKAAGLTDPALKNVAPGSEVALFKFAPLKAGLNLNLRISETHTDAKAYRLDGKDLVFEHSFSNALNAVVLPPGWLLTGSASPAAISQTPDNRTRLDFKNPRNDNMTVMITARRAP